MNKKILVCAYSCVSESGVKNIGGEAELGWNLVKELARFFSVSVLTHSNNQKSIETLLLKEKINNINFIYFKLPLLFNFLEKHHRGGIQVYAYLWQIKAYFVAKRLHKENKFDVFHHITYANDWMASFIGALLPIPYIRGPGGGAHKVPAGFVKEYTFKQKIAEKLRSIGQWVFRHDPFFILGQKRAKVLMACNYEAKNAISKKLQNKVYFFPVNGISKNNFNFENKRKEKLDKFIIFTAGKLIKIKSFDLAIKAFGDFSKKNTNTILSIAGEGPELNNLKNIVKNLNLENKVLFKGWLPREHVLQEMLNCDVFLFPSLRDGGGNVVVEAMAQGKPVVCFDISGPGFHVDQSCGIKIKPENSKQALKDMVESLEKLYNDKNLRLKLGQGAREKAEREYDWYKLGDRLFKIYKKFL